MRSILLSLSILVGACGDDFTLGDGCELQAEAYCDLAARCGDGNPDCFDVIMASCCVDSDTCDAEPFADPDDIEACAREYGAFTCQQYEDGANCTSL